MKKLEKITNNIISDKELYKRISKSEHYNIDEFIKDAFTYIKAIKEGKMICMIKSVAPSGMSRKIKFSSLENSNKRYFFRNYISFLIILGYRFKNNSDAFTVSGCGMDIVFNTNYTIIHRLYRLGFINKKQCNVLCQKTPVVL